MTEGGKYMADKLKDRAKHALLALLLSAGLVMPLCGILDASLLSLRLIFICTGVIAAFETVSMHRISAWAAAALTAAGALIWILVMGGMSVLSDAGLAVGLRIQGIMSAVPLAAKPISALTAAGITLLCCFACLKKATCIPAVMLCTAVMMLVWLSDSMEMLPLLLPAITATLALLMTYRFEDTDITHVLPWTAVLTLAAFMLTGAAPANNPVKSRADEIRQSVLDRLFFTEARDVFSLYSVGYSPQGADQLGGKPNPSNAAVMQVSTDRMVWLRGTVYNRYDGHGWQNTTGGRRYLWQSSRMTNTRSALFDGELPPESVQNYLNEPVTVSVRMLNGSASTLFVPQRVRGLNPGGEMVPYFSNSSEIFITRNLQAGDTYEVNASLYSADDPGIGSLVQVCAEYDDPRWEIIRNIYLELPSHLEQPLADLAARITADAETPYEKARAIREYLKKNCEYTLDVAEHPVNADFVTAFLMNTKRGYCTYFASAMTVLCRLAGLPSRYIEGYLAVPNEHGEAIVIGTDAHAWTEVYFAGFGWLTFDATPGRTTAEKRDNGSGGPTEPVTTPTPPPGQKPEEATDPDDAGETPLPDEENTDGPSENASEKKEDQQPDTFPEPDEKTDQADDHPPKGPRFPWWILLLIPAVLVSRMAVTAPLFKEKNAKTEEERFEIWTNDVSALLRSEHLERANGETVIAFAHRVDASCRFSESVLPAAECLCVIRYSTAWPRESDTGLMRDTALLLRDELKGKGKVRYLVSRMLPRKKDEKKGYLTGRRRQLKTGRREKT